MVAAKDNVFLTREYSDEDMAYIAGSVDQENTTIVINRRTVLNPSMIDKICRFFKATDVRVSIPIGNTSSSTIFDEEETEILKQNFAKLEENNFKTLFFEDKNAPVSTGYTLAETISASEKIAEWAREINSAKVFGRDLSPLEKFIYAYDFVTRFVHKKGETKRGEEVSPMDSRNLVRVLNGDKIVCIGYATMLAELCKRIDIPCLIQLVVDGADEKAGFNKINHAICKVYLKDEIYDYDGIVNADASKDAYKNSFGQTICHAAQTNQEIQEIYGGKVKLAGESWFYAETLNEFMDGVRGFKTDNAESLLEMRYLSAGIEKVLVDIFERNVEKFEKNRAKRGFGDIILEHQKLEKTYFPSIYEELYRYVINPKNEYFLLDVERAISQTVMATNLSLDDLFCELLDYGNRFKPNEYVLEELVEMVEDARAKESFDDMKTIADESEPVDPLMLFEALTNVIYSRVKNEERAVIQANRIFEESIDFAMCKWDLSRKTDNYFHEEAVKLRDAFGKTLQVRA